MKENTHLELLVAPAGMTVLVEHDATGKCEEATADDNGIVRNSDGESYSLGAYSIVAEGTQ